VLKGDKDCLTIDRECQLTFLFEHATKKGISVCTRNQEREAAGTDGKRESTENITKHREYHKAQLNKKEPYSHPCFIGLS
jgi:hypothetical protein